MVMAGVVPWTRFATAWHGQAWAWVLTSACMWACTRLGLGSGWPCSCLALSGHACWSCRSTNLARHAHGPAHACLVRMACGLWQGYVLHGLHGSHGWACTGAGHWPCACPGLWLGLLSEPWHGLGLLGAGCKVLGHHGQHMGSLAVVNLARGLDSIPIAR